jgi:hypothetical protein
VCNLAKQILFKVEVEYRLYPAPPVQRASPVKRYCGSKRSKKATR